ATPSDFPPAAGTQAVVNPSPLPTSTPLPQVANTPLPTAIPAPTQAAVAATPAPTQLPAGSVTTYTVQAGDRLFSIGRRFGVNPYSIAQANNIPPPYIIHPGRVLNISGGGTVTPAPGGRTHLVAPGENLFRISLRYGTTVQALAAANNIANVNLIFIGQVLKIP
ncbi:MAG: LysM peptidoglycan-binding domain-containing protein, partial [Anaerolineae bacterium]